MTYWNPDEPAGPDFPSWFTGPMPDLSGADCATVDPELFFPAGPGSHNEKVAKRICAACPMLNECRDYALATPNLQGTWGGTTDRERGTIRGSLEAEEAAA